MKRLIVNADDFGLTESVNRGIIAAHREGILTSTSLLANGLAFEQAVALSRQSPRLSVGVHLNISSGLPVSPSGSISSLVNQRGELCLNPFALWIRILAQRINLEEIRSEFRAQILRVFDAGLTPTHLDGHLHVHVLPQIFPLVIAMAREFSIRYVRCPAENLQATLPILWKTGGGGIAALQRAAIAFAVSSYARVLREKLRESGLASSNEFYGLAHTGFLDAKMLSALLDRIPSGVTELMCHPGYPSPELERLGGTLSGSREIEVLALTAQETKERIANLGICLVNFRDLEARVRD